MRRCLVVAGEQDDANSGPDQRLNGIGRRGLDRVGDGEETCDLAIHGHEDDSTEHGGRDTSRTVVPDRFQLNSRVILCLRHASLSGLLDDLTSSASNNRGLSPVPPQPAINWERPVPER